MSRPDRDDNAEGEHWLTREVTVRRLWMGGLLILAATVVADLFVSHHPHFGIDGTFAFGAWFGFLACLGLVLLAKLLGIFLKRPDSYYDN